MYNSYIKLTIATLLPVFAAIVLYLLNKKTPFGKINNKVKQVIFGIIFGLLAVLGTEWGIPLNGAQVNCRDAAVLIAGLLFGGPAGIIAGIIGGVERWLAVYWGIGTFTRIACSVSTVLAGLYSALLRKYMFEDKKPGWVISLAIGVVMEVFHLTMVFVTNLHSPDAAIAVVKACTAPMIIANGVSVMLATIAVTLLSKERMLKKGQIRISRIIQKWLLVAVILAFFATTIFVYFFQNGIADSNTETSLSMAIDETQNDIKDTTNKNLINLSKEIAAEVGTLSLAKLSEKYDVPEINIVNSLGIITESTNPTFVGYDMGSAEQSGEFLRLLGDLEVYAQDYGPIAFDRTIYRKYIGIKKGDGFIQFGYAANGFQQYIDEKVVDLTSNRHTGETGYVLIVDNQLKVVSCPAGFDKSVIENNIQNAKNIKPDTIFTATIDDTKCYCKYTSVEGYYIASVLPVEEALKMRNIALYVNTFMEVLVFAILFGLIYLLIKRVVVDQIKSINQSLSKIASGNLDEVVNVRNNEEFASLSDDINSTVNTLKHYIDEASARIDKELEFAKNIQKSALPSIFPAFPKRTDVDIYASMNAAKEVGGDFYDFYITNNDTLNLLIADVSGKGIPAAMFMMRAKTELKSLTEADMPLNEVFTKGNAALCEGNSAGMFVTAWQCSINLKNGNVQLVNAGHNPPLVRHKDGTFEYLKLRAGFVLAGMEGVTYKTQQLQLEPGDTLYLYTDGVTEATNQNSELFGEERLLAALNSKNFNNMEEMCKFVKSEVDAFVGDAPQFDDITMVGFNYIGTEPNPSVHFDEASIEDIPAVTEFVETSLEKIGCSMKTIMQFNVAIDEIYSNIVRYGYKKKAGPVTVELIYNKAENTVSLKFVDEGIPYNPLNKEDPDVTLSAEDREIGGLGIFLVKKTMDDMKYIYENNQNILIITKNI